MGQELFPHKWQMDAAGKLEIDRTFVPCPVEDGDEIYPNGIFLFNITKLLEHIEQNPGQYLIEEIPVENLSLLSSSLKDDRASLADITRPIILAEISPGRYAVIDGHHRLERARRMMVETIPAYRLHVHQHIPFLIEKRAYIAYVEYWNSKIV
jgi:hypothetical protein